MDRIITTNEIHIWSACLETYEKDISYFSSILSPGEIQYAEKFTFIDHRSKFIIARGILRTILSEYLEYLPQDIEIIYGPWGKPSLSPNFSLHFNISHSGKYALYAFATRYEIGIDLEYKNGNLEVDDLAKTLFSSQGMAYLKTLGSSEKKDFFFKFWVCKEAYLKALGKGWLAHEENMSPMELYIIKEDRLSIGDKMVYPFYFECIPEYASAWFVNGPLLYPTYYQYDKESRIIRKPSLL